VLEFGHHIDQRGVERRVQQAKVVVMESRHVRAFRNHHQSATSSSNITPIIFKSMSK
jgi:hypothetical protein